MNITWALDEEEDGSLDPIDLLGEIRLENQNQTIPFICVCFDTWFEAFITAYEQLKAGVLAFPADLIDEPNLVLFQVEGNGIIIQYQHFQLPPCSLAELHQALYTAITDVRDFVRQKAPPDSHVTQQRMYQFVE